MKFAVFDIDGTLIRWQLYHALVDRLAKEGLLGEDTHELLHEARMRWKRRETNEGFSEYEKTLITTYEKALPALRPEQVDRVVKEVAKEYQDQVYKYTRELINQLKSEGYFLLAISGSHQELVTPIAKHYGFDDSVGTQYERSESGFSGKVMVASHHKEQLLTDFMRKHALERADSYAVGDSKSDVTMLEMVENPIAFNPDQALFAIAQQRAWKVVIERKNVVYQLEQISGHYQLVETS